MARARPSAALLASVLLHAGAVGLFFVAWPRSKLPPAPESVPVSIISSEVIQAAAPDNPSEELVTEDGASAPVETPPEPAPPEPVPPAPAPPPPAPRPTPTPQPRPPEKARPTPPQPAPPEKARPTPPRPSPAAPAPKRNAPSLDLDALAGPPRPRPNSGRPATGQQGAGQASQATGPQLSALARQVTPNWNVRVVCDLPGGDEIVLRVRVRLDANGRIQGNPQVEGGRNDATWRAASDGILQALRATSPFDVPTGFAAQEVPFRFETARQCAAR